MFSKAIIAASLGAAGALAQTAVSSSTYSNIVKYTKYAGAAYAENCPQIPNGASLLQTFNFSSVDEKALLFHDTSSNEIVLSFRGSAFPQNLDQDFLFNLEPLNITGTSCSSCNVHAGFQNLYNQLWPTINGAVQSALFSNFGSSLVITGHSLGGALASLAATQFAAQGTKVTPYTFGEPRNGDPNFTTYVNKLLPTYYRVTHSYDGVPQIPPTILGFEHHGTEYWESEFTGNSASTTYQCSGIEPQNCNAAQNFGSDPINGAHIQYSDFLVASVLFNPSCGYVEP